MLTVMDKTPSIVLTSSALVGRTSVLGKKLEALTIISRTLCSLIFLSLANFFLTLFLVPASLLLASNASVRSCFLLEWCFFQLAGVGSGCSSPLNRAPMTESSPSSEGVNYGSITGVAKMESMLAQRRSNSVLIKDMSIVGFRHYRTLISKTSSLLRTTHIL